MIMELEQTSTPQEDRQNNHHHKHYDKSEKKDRKQALFTDNQQLILEIYDLGYTDVKLISKGIQKGLNKDQIVEFVKQKQEKRNYKQKSEKTPKKDYKLSEFSEQFVELASKGFENPCQIFKTLKKTEGNVQKAEEILSHKQQRWTQKAEKKNGKRQKEQAYTQQIRFLLENGVFRVQLMYRALDVCNGDAQKALQWIQEAPEKHKKEKRSRSRSKSHKKDKKEKREKREKKERIPRDLELDQQLMGLKLDSWDDKITQVYIDANNLFFVNSTIRGLVIKGEKKKAELILCEIFKQAGVAFQGLQNTIVIFDNTKLSVNESGFQVMSAMPQYESSDDLLADQSGQLGSEVLKTTLFVTSDQGLIKRLLNNGVTNVMKSGTFLKEAEQVLTTQNFENIISNYK